MHPVPLVLGYLLILLVVGQAACVGYLVFYLRLLLLHRILSNCLWRNVILLLLRNLPVDSDVVGRGCPFVHLHVVELDLADVATSHFNLPHSFGQHFV